MLLTPALALFKAEVSKKPSYRAGWNNALIQFFENITYPVHPHDYFYLLHNEAAHIIYCDEALSKSTQEHIFSAKHNYIHIGSYAGSIVKDLSEDRPSIPRAKNARFEIRKLMQLILAYQNGKISFDIYRRSDKGLSRSAHILYSRFSEITNKVFADMASELPNLHKLADSITALGEKVSQSDEIEQRLTKRESELTTAIAELETRWRMANDAMEARDRALKERENALDGKIAEVERIAETLAAYFSTMQTQNKALLDGITTTPPASSTNADLLALIEALKSR